MFYNIEFDTKVKIYCALVILGSLLDGALGYALYSLGILGG